MRKQANPLKDIADGAPQHRRVLLSNVLAIDMDRATGWLNQSVDHLQSRRLSASRRTQQNQCFPVIYMER